MALTPMPLVRVAAPFSDPGWLWELKYDGFRALAYLDGGTCRLVSRNGNTFTRFDPLAAGLAQALPTATAILDGEIVCLDDTGCSQFRRLFFRRSAPIFAAFDILRLGNDDLCALPLLERKHRLQLLVEAVQGPLLRVRHVAGTEGPALHERVCALDLEGIVGKWATGTYQTGGTKTSWVKVKNPSYSQAEGREELFTPSASARRSRARLVLE